MQVLEDHDRRSAADDVGRRARAAASSRVVERAPADRRRAAQSATSRLVVGRAAASRRASRSSSKGRPRPPGSAWPASTRVSSGRPATSSRTSRVLPMPASPPTSAMPGPWHAVQSVRSWSSWPPRPTITGLRPVRPTSMGGAYRPARTWIGSRAAAAVVPGSDRLEVPDRHGAGAGSRSGRSGLRSARQPRPSAAGACGPSRPAAASCGGRSPGSRPAAGSSSDAPRRVGSTTQSNHEEIVRL